MKTKTMALLLLSVLSLQTVIAEEMALPVITKPSVLEEGTERSLTNAQIAELIPWAKDSKMFLSDLVDGVAALSTSDKIDRLEMGIQQVVGESAPKHSELLMRYVLNRALVLKQTLADEMDGSAVGSDDAKLRILNSSIKLAIKYYETDMNTLSKKSTPDFQAFGEDYFRFLNELNKSIFDASAQYTIQRISLEWLQWDLYRDLNNTRFAPKIVKINNALKMSPTTKMKDAQYIRSLQQLKKVSQQMDILNQVEVKSAPALAAHSSSEMERMRKYAYSSPSSKCYLRSANNEIMYSAPAENSFCAKAGSYQYSNASGKCYKKSLWGDIMYGDPVSNDNCAQPNAYFYSSGNSACYKKSLNGDVMYSDRVDSAYCAMK